MNQLPTLPIFCPACKRTVYLLVELLKQDKAVCTCGAITPTTPEFAAFVRGIK